MGTMVRMLIFITKIVSVYVGAGVYIDVDIQYIIQIYIVDFVYLDFSYKTCLNDI